MKICEIFEDLEGEGRYQGTPTLFIRLTGCNLRCRWCDTKYSYENGKEMSISDILKRINKSRCKYINITGGEPLIYKKEVVQLINKIKGKFVSVETNGSISVFGVPANNISMDLKLPGSDEHEKVRFSNLKLLRARDQVKLVASSIADLEYAVKILGKYKTKALIVVQPAYKKLALNKIKNFVMKKGLNWKVMIQLHKLKS